MYQQNLPQVVRMWVSVALIDTGVFARDPVSPLGRGYGEPKCTTQARPRNRTIKSEALSNCVDVF